MSAIFLIVGCGNKSQIDTQIIPRGWVYVDEKDEFTGKKTQYVSIESDNKELLSVTSSRQINAYLHVNRNHKNLLIRFNGFAQPYLYSGFGCRSGLCHVLVKFDGGEIEKYNLHEPDIGSGLNGFSLVLAQNGAGNFIKKAFKAQKIEIRMNFHDVGKVNFNFSNPKPFEWPN